MKYFLDTEFIEDGKTIDLISIGIVAENGREYYAQSLECDFTKASQWVKDNVFPHLEDYPAPQDIRRNEASMATLQRSAWRSRYSIAKEIISFIGIINGDPKPEFWGYYADYDWIVFCQLFGTMMDLPKGFPMYCCDIKQLCDSLGNPKLPEQGKGEHHALADAKWNKIAYEFLVRLS